MNITIKDVDDNCPIFNPAHYKITIREDISKDTILVKIMASDADEGNICANIIRSVDPQ